MGVRTISVIGTVTHDRNGKPSGITVLCPYCRKQHTHGYSLETCHKNAHCSPEFQPNPGYRISAIVRADEALAESEKPCSAKMAKPRRIGTHNCRPGARIAWASYGETPDWMQQARLLTGDDPFSGKTMTREERERYSRLPSKPQPVPPEKSVKKLYTFGF